MNSQAIEQEQSLEKNIQYNVTQLVDAAFKPGSTIYREGRPEFNKEIESIIPKFRTICELAIRKIYTELEIVNPVVIRITDGKQDGFIDVFSRVHVNSDALRYFGRDLRNFYYGIPESSGNQKELIDSFKTSFSTLFHEFRHIWQFAQGWDFSDYLPATSGPPYFSKFNSREEYDKAVEEYEKYYNHPVEVDAREYEDKAPEELASELIETIDKTELYSRPEWVS